MRHAPLALRIAAYLVDAAVLAAMAFLVLQVVPPLFGIDPLRERDGIRLEIFALAFISAPAWLYFALCESSPAQATIGKLLLGLYVTDDDGGRLRLWPAFQRTLIKLLPWEAIQISALIPTPIFVEGAFGFRLGFMLAYGLVIVYLGFAFMSTDRQSIHDMIMDTCVLQRPRKLWIKDGETSAGDEQEQETKHGMVGDEGLEPPTSSV